MVFLLIILALLVLISGIAVLIGLFKVIVPFDKDDKAFGVKLLIYGTIIVIIGFGACTAIASI